MTAGAGQTRDAPTVLFSAQRDEGPFLLEWVAYHKVIGFDRIIVASNDCRDGSDRFLDALASAGEITHLASTVPEQASAQATAARRVQESGTLVPGCWVMWLDSDEYLLPHGEGSSVRDILKAIGPADALSLPWRFFGDSGNAHWPGRQISDRFTRAEARNRRRSPQVKTLFRFDARIERLDIHRPVLRPGETPESYRWIGGSGAPVDPAFFRRDRRNPFNRLTDHGRIYRFGQVMHFSVRTPDMFTRKASRGDGYFAASANPVVRDGSFYGKKNKNAAEERSALWLVPAITAEMERLCENSDIRQAAQAIDGFDLTRMGLSLN